MGVDEDTVRMENKMLRWYGLAERRDDVDDRRTHCMPAENMEGRRTKSKETKNINKGQEKFEERRLEQLWNIPEEPNKNGKPCKRNNSEMICIQLIN
jgi:hypothetical protein